MTNSGGGNDLTTPNNISNEKRALDIFWKVNKILQRLDFRYWSDADRAAKPIKEALDQKDAEIERLREENLRLLQVGGKFEMKNAALRAQIESIK